MSTNIDHWKTIKIENLVIPYEFAESDVRWGRDNTLTVRWSEDGGIKGTLIEVEDKNLPDLVAVRAVRFRGIGSGTAWNNFHALLQRSTGYFECLIAWEDGDRWCIVSDNGKTRRKNRALEEIQTELNRLRDIVAATKNNEDSGL